MYTTEQFQALSGVYRSGLLEDVVPFWIRHGIDREHGGYLTALDRDGAVLDTDKGMWQQGRFAWLLSTLHETESPGGPALSLAEHGLNFIGKAGFAPSGHMYFQVDRGGRPLRERRYAYSEAFAAIAYGAYARAAKDDEAASRARACFQAYNHYTGPESPYEGKIIRETRPMRGLGPLMIRINTAQVLRDTLDDQAMTAIIDETIADLQKTFLNHEHRALLEVAGPGGDMLDHFDGRLLNPGHALEAAWFILHESACRGNDRSLRELGCTILDWMWTRGWDEEYGGIRYFCDVKGLPVQEYWHDMKFWWPQCEAIIATLIAGILTGEARYFEWHRKIHDWTFERFPDAVHGEWYGYLHRDGHLSVPLKGNLWKGPFHIPRMQWYCARLCDWAAAGASGPVPGF